MYKYVFDDPSGSTGSWECLEEAVPFKVWNHSSLTYRPNMDFSELYRIPGWLYTLGGRYPNWNQLWRYSLPAYQDTAIDGTYPPDGSTIGDATPRFSWDEEPEMVEYRLQVSGLPDFTILEIDVVTELPEYQVQEQEALPNGPHYWRTASVDANQQVSIYLERPLL